MSKLIDLTKLEPVISDSASFAASGSASLDPRKNVPDGFVIVETFLMWDMSALNGAGGNGTFADDEEFFDFQDHYANAMEWNVGNVHPLKGSIKGRDVCVNNAVVNGNYPVMGPITRTGAITFAAAQAACFFTPIPHYLNIPGVGTKHCPRVTDLGEGVLDLTFGDGQPTIGSYTVTSSAGTVYLGHLGYYDSTHVPDGTLQHGIVTGLSSGNNDQLGGGEYYYLAMRGVNPSTYGHKNGTASRFGVAFSGVNKYTVPNYSAPIANYLARFARPYDDGFDEAMDIIDDLTLFSAAQLASGPFSGTKVTILDANVFGGSRDYRWVRIFRGKGC